MLSCLPVYITRSLVTASHKKTSKRRKIGVQLDKIDILTCKTQKVVTLRNMVLGFKEHLRDVSSTCGLPTDAQ